MVLQEDEVRSTLDLWHLRAVSCNSPVISEAVSFCTFRSHQSVHCCLQLVSPICAAQILPCGEKCIRVCYPLSFSIAHPKNLALRLPFCLEKEPTLTRYH